MKQQHGKLLLKESMAHYTSWQVGGIADRLYRPQGLADLAVFLRTLSASEPVTWVGLGSNLLVRDGGIRGTVIITLGCLTGLAPLNALDRKSVV